MTDIDFSQFKDAQDFCKQMGFTMQQAFDFLISKT